MSFWYFLYFYVILKMCGMLWIWIIYIMNNRDKRVLVGMSGGIDSFVMCIML